MQKQAVLKPGVQTPLSGSSMLLRIYEKVKYELPILIFLLIVYVPQNISIIDDVYTAVHVFDYSIVGFAPRLFIGSLMSLFIGYKSLAAMSLFMDIVCIGALFLYTWTAGRLIRKASPETKEITVLLVVLFIALPYSLAALYPRLLSLDRYMVLIALFALMALNNRFAKWLVPVFIVAGLAVYHGFAFTYMPAVAVLLLYRIHQDNYTKRSIALCAAGFAVMAVFSAYFYLYTGVDSFANAEELAAYISDKTDIIAKLTAAKANPYADTVTMLLFKNPFEFWDRATLSNDITGDIITDLRAMSFMLPLFAIFFIVWKNAVKNASTRFEKFVFILCILAPLARTPMFVLSQNPFRCRISVVVIQFFLLFYFLYTENPAVLKALKTVGEFFKKNYLLFLTLVVYFAMAFLAFKTGAFWNTVRAALDGRF